MNRKKKFFKRSLACITIQFSLYNIFSKQTITVFIERIFISINLFLHLKKYFNNKRQVEILYLIL